MSNRFLKSFTYIYLLLPILIFIIGWVKPLIAIVPVVFGILIIRKMIKNSNQELEATEKIILKKDLYILFGLITLICVWGGLGGFFYQSSDWNYRNAIFRDLINYKWPVFYRNSALTYYIGIWMVPAMIGKAFLPLGEGVAWQVGNIALLLWCSIGITMVILWLIKIWKIKNLKRIIIVLVLFLGFSGLDMLGCIIQAKYHYNAVAINPNLLPANYFINNNSKNLLLEDAMHLERWTTFFQFSSMITQIFWVFNQAIVPWLITIVFMEETCVKKYALLLIVCMAYGPLPAVGLCFFMMIRGIKFLIIAIRQKKIKDFIKDIFSPENIVALFLIFPIYFFYYTNNSAINDELGNGLRIIKEVLNLKGIAIFVLFYVLEVGLYGLVLWKRNKKNELFIGAFIALIWIPFVAIGNAYDFGMRASIPALVIIDYYFVEFVIAELEKIKEAKFIEIFKSHLGFIFVILIFAFGLFTPMVEMTRGFVAIESNIPLKADNVYSLSRKRVESITNFVCVNPKENSIFFKYIAK